MRRVEKKKKAFTLIELLAVIVILAIIALIATPIIGKLVDRARKEAFKESAVGVIRAGENYMGKYILKNHADPSFPIVFVCNGTECTNGEEALDIAGKVPKSGSIILENHKSIKAEYLSDGKYCVAGVKSNLQVANSCADIDVTKPTVSVEAEGLILKITMTDNESGIASYCVTNENTTSNCSWIDTTDTYKEHEVTNGTWYVFAKDNKGNISNAIDGVLAERITFAEQILIDNPTILTNPTLTGTSTAASENGLYSMSVTNGFGGADGTTYFFRGNVSNNYVSFANKTWRIVRINEDGTVRLILDDMSETNYYTFNTNYGNYTYMYYSNSSFKTDIENWYAANITGTNAAKVATGNYFCEAAKVAWNKSSNTSQGTTGMVLYSNYTPDFTCENDDNNKGLLNLSIGLINYDEVVFAGGYRDTANENYYLHNGNWFWTMSPTGMLGSKASIWRVNGNGCLYTNYANGQNTFRPVINLKSTVTVTGSGTSANPYVVK